MWVDHLSTQSIGPHQRVVEPLVTFAERTGRAVALSQKGDPLVTRSRSERIGQPTADPAAVLGQQDACGESRDAFVGEQVADPQHPEGVGLELRGECRKKQPAAVLSLVRRVARVPAAGPDVGG
ncbi:MAG TPA: hypothetical protein VGL99_06945 [Chloroflexota bacterium]